MVLTVHHLQISQSDRIVWLCEELGIEYKLVLHTRAPMLAPESLKSVPGNKTGKAPFVSDSSNGVQLSETGAIAQYIIAKYGNDKFSVKPEDSAFGDYLYWLHFANSTLVADFVTSMFVSLTTGPPEDMPRQLAEIRLHNDLKCLDERLSENKWLAGSEFTVADIMNTWPVTGQRYFGPQVSLAKYPNILRWLQDCAARPAYQRTLEKGDPEMKPLLGAEPPEGSLLDVNGVESDIWKK